VFSRLTRGKKNKGAANQQTGSGVILSDEHLTHTSDVELCPADAFVGVQFVRVARVISEQYKYVTTGS